MLAFSEAEERNSISLLTFTGILKSSFAPHSPKVSSQGWLLAVYSIAPRTEAELYRLILLLRFQFCLFFESRGKPEPQALVSPHGDYYRQQYNDVLPFGFFSSPSCSQLFHLFFDCRWELSWFFHGTGTQRTCPCTVRGCSGTTFCVKFGLFILPPWESFYIYPAWTASFLLSSTVSPWFYNSN